MVWNGGGERGTPEEVGEDVDWGAGVKLRSGWGEEK
jgi:hypothetical protein